MSATATSAHKRYDVEVAGWYQSDRDRRLLPEALIEGVEAMRTDANGARRWMWENPGEMDLVESGGTKTLTRYQIRVKRSTLRNVWKDTLMSAAALPFRQDVAVAGLDGAAYEEILQDLKYNLDGSGGTITQMMRIAFKGKLIRGIHYWFVDLAPVSGGPSRPVVRHVYPDDVLDFDDGFEDGRRRLKYLKLRHCVRDLEFTPESPDSPQEVIEERQLVYLAGELDAPSGTPESYVRYMQRRQVKSADGKSTTWERIYDETLPGDGGMWNYMLPERGEMRDIPLVPFVTDFETPYRGAPPFLDTAEEQASHWRQKSEKDELARKVANPLLFVSGVDTDAEGNIDQRSIRFFGGMGAASNADASATLLETSGASLAALAEELRQTEEAIRVGNLQPLANRPEGNVTATEIGLHAFRAHSQLEAWTAADQASATLALEYALKLAGLSVPKELAVTMAVSFSRGEEVRGILKELYLGSKMSPEGFFALMKSAGMLPEEFDVDAEVASLRSTPDFNVI